MMTFPMPCFRRIFEPSTGSFVVLAGVAAAAFSLTPHAARAQAQATDVDRDLTTAVPSIARTAAPLIVPHNGKQYLFRRVTPQDWVQPNKEYNVNYEKYRKIYEVRVAGEDGVFKNPKPFGLSLFPSLSTNPEMKKKTGLGMSSDAFTMPFAAVEMDSKNLLIVFACSTTDSATYQAGAMGIKVRNVDALISGQDGNDTDAEQPLVGSQGSRDVSFADANHEPLSTGISAAAYARPGTATTEPKTGFMVAYSTLRRDPSFTKQELVVRLISCLYTNGKLDTPFNNADRSFRLPDGYETAKAHHWGGDVAVQVVPYSGPPVPNLTIRYIAYLALVRDDGIQVARVLLGASATGQVDLIQPNQIQWGFIKTDGSTPYFTPALPAYAVLNKGPFGDVSVTYRDEELRAHEIGLVETSAFAFPTTPNARGTNRNNGNWATSFSDDWYAVDRGYPLRNRAKTVAGSTDALDERGPQINSIPNVVYSFDAAHTTSDKNADNPILKNVYLPMMGKYSYLKKDSYGDAGHLSQHIAQVGRAQRQALNPIKARKDVLVGIIEGPPPFPAENLLIPTDKDTRTSKNNVSEIKSTDANSTDTTVKSALTKTKITKWNSKSSSWDIGSFWEKQITTTEGDSSSGLAKLTEDTTTATIESAYSAKANLVALVKDGPLTPVPTATVFVLTHSWGGYVYELVDEQGRMIPGSPEYFELFPLSPEIRADTVFLNPRAAKPGNLNSYIRTTTELEAMEKNSTISDPNGKHHINFSWTPSGKVTPKYTASFKNAEGSEDTTASKLLSGTSVVPAAEIPSPGGVVGKVAGYAANYLLKAVVSKDGELSGDGMSSSISYNTGAGGVWGLTCDTDVPGNLDYGGYVSFSYDVYQLKPDKKYTDELFATADDSKGLVTGNWPDTTVRKKINADFLKNIDPNSMPWKITYAVSHTSHFLLPGDVAGTDNKNFGTLAAGGVRTMSIGVPQAPPTGALPDALKAKLDAAKLSSPGLIDTAYSAAFETNAELKSSAKTMLDKVKLRDNTAFDVSKALAVMQALSLDEKKQVVDYLASQTKLADAQFEKARGIADKR